MPVPVSARCSVAPSDQMSEARDGRSLRPTIPGSRNSIESIAPTPVMVIPADMICTRPRSDNLAPLSCNNMFDGLMLRCAIPASCKA